MAKNPKAKNKGGRPIEWRVESWEIGRFKTYDKNPRQFTKKGMSDLRRSIDRFGLAEPIVVNTDGTVIGGHARLHTIKERGDTHADAYVPDRTLTEKEVEELNVRLNANIAGEWDYDILANGFELADLQDWGLELPETPDLEPVPIDEQPRLDMKKPVTCPNCGHEF